MAVDPHAPGQVVELRPPSDLAVALDHATAAYGAELRRWREARGLSKRRLAAEMAYDRSYPTQIENGTLPPTEAFTQRAEDILDCGGALLQRWEAWHAAKARLYGAAGPPSVRPTAPGLDQVIDRLADLVLDRVSADVLDWLGSMQTQLHELTTAVQLAAERQAAAEGMRPRRHYRRGLDGDQSQLLRRDSSQ